eukprot:1157702-Pelagomonas_calceolata.AAC.4
MEERAATEQGTPLPCLPAPPVIQAHLPQPGSCCAAAVVAAGACACCSWTCAVKSASSWEREALLPPSVPPHHPALAAAAAAAAVAVAVALWPPPPLPPWTTLAACALECLKPFACPPWACFPSQQTVVCCCWVPTKRSKAKKIFQDDRPNH